jgi:hypothetical protein
MKSRKHLESGSLHVIILVGASAVLIALLGLVFWQRLDAQNNTIEPVEKVATTESQKALTLPSWNAQIPLPATASDFVVDSSSFSAIFAKEQQMSSYGIKLKGGSGCHATPDYVATIMQMESDAPISSSLADQSSRDGHNNDTWLQYYQRKLEENKDSTKSVQGVKEIGKHVYVLMIFPSKCPAPSSSTEEGKKINQLRDAAAAELKTVFNDLEAAN